MAAAEVRYLTALVVTCDLQSRPRMVEVDLPC